MNRREFLRIAGAAAGTAACSVNSSATSSAANPASPPSRLDSAPKRKPNVLILITDQQSAGTSSYRLGQRYLHTPNMDSLAAGGTTFTRAYCANPLCIPSRNSMFTGRYPTETGIMDNSHSVTALDPRKFPFMGRIFQRGGYRTAYFGKWHLVCFEDENGIHGFETMATTVNDDTAAALATAEFLRKKHDAPFLAVASFLNPHNICEWARGQRLPLGAIGNPPPVAECPPLRPNHAPQEHEPDIMALMRRSYQRTPMFPVGGFSPAKWREYLWAYYRLIEKADAQIGAVLQALHSSGLEEDTLVVFVSDHGDCQGAHGWNQKTVFYEEASRVPLIFTQKGITRRGVSRRLVNTGIDLLPTLCDYAGIAPPSSLPGQSLKNVPFDSLDPRRYVVASNKMVQGAPVAGHKPTPSGRMVRSQRYKYCVYDEGQRRESLVDLEADPGEMLNLAGDPRLQNVLRQHRAMLSEWCSQTGDVFPIPSA